MVEAKMQYGMEVGQNAWKSKMNSSFNPKLYQSTPGSSGLSYHWETDMSSNRFYSDKKLWFTENFHKWFFVRVQYMPIFFRNVKGWNVKKVFYIIFKLYNNKKRVWWNLGLCYYTPFSHTNTLNINKSSFIYAKININLKS